MSNPQKIYIVARGNAKPDQVEKVKKILTSLMESTRLETGCLRYDVMQNQNDPTDFTTIEEWSDQGSVDSHFETSHFLKAMDQMAGLLSLDPEIRYYQPISK